MATEGKDQRYIELLPGQWATFQAEAERLGLLQTTGPGKKAGRGSVSRFLQYLAGLLEVGYTIPPKDGE